MVNELCHKKKNISDYFYGFYEGIFIWHLLLEVNL